MTQLFHIEKLDRSELMRLAIWMVDNLPPQLTIGITGTLGSGKTTFTQCVAEAAKIDPGAVTSPTFTLLQSHVGSINLHHMDAYRINDEDEFLELGVEELFEQQAWTLIEWADRVESVMPSDTLWLQIDLTDNPDCREFTFSSTRLDIGPAFEKLRTTDST